MMKLAVVSSVVASALALAPNGVQLKKAEVVSRREVGAGLMSAVTAFGAAAAANAAAGDSPKFSFFGIGGNADTYSEGAAYGIDVSRPSYSPYSPYGEKGGGVYKKFSADEVAFKKKLLAESVKRVSKVNTYIEKKQWEEVRAELDRQVYSMRGTMNYLAAGNPAAEKAAKIFYADMEAVTLLSKKKKQDAAAAAFTDMMASLDAYTKLI